MFTEKFNKNMTGIIVIQSDDLDRRRLAHVSATAAGCYDEEVAMGL